MPGSILLWLMRSFEGNENNDATLEIKRTSNGFTVYYIDKVLKCNDSISFTNMNDLFAYLDIFTLNILADRDATKPFRTIQYMIPGFPATVIKRWDLNNEKCYNLFCDTISFYLTHTSD
jgi:hypothetical protein